MSNNLITIRNYANKMGVSTAWIYKKIKLGLLSCEIIDGVKFIKVK